MDAARRSAVQNVEYHGRRRGIYSGLDVRNMSSTGRTHCGRIDVLLCLLSCFFIFLSGYFSSKFFFRVVFVFGDSLVVSNLSSSLFPIASCICAGWPGVPGWTKCIDTLNIFELSYSIGLLLGNLFLQQIVSSSPSLVNPVKTTKWPDVPKGTFD